jgi:hypothetical protein
MSGSSSDDWERRREARYQLLAEVRVGGADATPVLELGNLSRSGALVCFGDLPKPGWVRLGHTVQMDIINPDNLDALEVTGEIVRVQEDADGHGFAVRFKDCDAAQTEIIDDLIDIADRISALPPPPNPALAAPPSSRRVVPPPLPVDTGPPSGRTSGPPPLPIDAGPPSGRTSGLPPLPIDAGPPSGRTSGPLPLPIDAGPPSGRTSGPPPLPKKSRKGDKR